MWGTDFLEIKEDGVQRCPRNSGSSFIGKEKNVTGTLDEYLVKARSSEIIQNQFLSFRLRLTSQIENTKSVLIFACFIGLGALVLLEKLHQEGTSLQALYTTVYHHPHSVKKLNLKNSFFYIIFLF